MPSAPGWPFADPLRLACLHSHFAAAVLAIAKPHDAIVHRTTWQFYTIDVSALGTTTTREASRPLAPGFSIGTVPEAQLDMVLATSSIKRQPSTLLILPNVGILDAGGKLVAWGYIGIDSSFATLYVVPDHRGKGLASVVARELLGKLARGGFAHMGYAGASGWVHADVARGNGGSEGVMRAVGGTTAWESEYVHVLSEKLP